MSVQLKRLKVVGRVEAAACGLLGGTGVKDARVESSVHRRSRFRDIIDGKVQRIFENVEGGQPTQCVCVVPA